MVLPRESNSLLLLLLLFCFLVLCFNFFFEYWRGGRGEGLHRLLFSVSEMLIKTRCRAEDVRFVSSGGTCRLPGSCCLHHITATGCLSPEPFCCLSVCVHARHICVRLVWMPRAYFIDTTIFKLVVWDAPVLIFIQYLPVRCNKIVSSYFASIILSSNDGTDMAGYGPIYPNFIIIKYVQVTIVDLMDHRKLLATIKLGRPVWLALSHFTTVCLRASFGVSRGRLTPTMTEEEQVGKHNGID